jgi:hypothetical protein
LGALAWTMGSLAMGPWDLVLDLWEGMC